MRWCRSSQEACCCLRDQRQKRKGAVHGYPHALGWIGRQTDLEQRVQNEGRLIGLDSTFCLNRALEQTVQIIAFEFAADGGRASRQLSRNACQSRSLAFEAVDLVTCGLG